jgi:hypothetical protein
VQDAPAVHQPLDLVAGRGEGFPHSLVHHERYTILAD